ncbi:MAG: TetR/AcrR family transcriptional regulator [Promethearchaeota archaeon]|nr:MAG: TetR/AcrR family transcriptional regulator [Candidatus Lokiarchaeota archaeon]
MKKGAAKEKIMKIAMTLFKEKGFGNTYVNEIASKAGVSIGTLYYHFPRGKFSILREMGDVSITDYSAKLKKFGYSLEYDYDTITDALKNLILALVKIHSEERDFILALQVEFLSKLDDYLKIKDQFATQEQLKTQTELFLRPFRELLKKFPEEGLVLNGKETQVFKVVDGLIHRHTFVNDTFGTEEDFVKMMTQIVLALLKPDY